MIHISIQPDSDSAGRAAAAFGGDAIRTAIEARGKANIVVATGTSQFAMLTALVERTDVDWSQVVAFHLDEYAGMSTDHPASFLRYLNERFVARLPSLGAFHGIQGDAPDLAAELNRLNTLIARHPIDVSFIGFGENGHIAFNDPPADFAATEPFRVLELDERCRRQQLGEGWFPTLEDVPHQAISMTVPQIMASRLIISTVPDRRKAEAVRDALEGPITPMVPASILRRHPACCLYLDPDSASLLSASLLKTAAADQGG